MVFRLKTNAEHGLNHLTSQFCKKNGGSNATVGFHWDLAIKIKNSSYNQHEMEDKWNKTHSV